MVICRISFTIKEAVLKKACREAQFYCLFKFMFYLGFFKVINRLISKTNFGPNTIF